MNLTINFKFCAKWHGVKYHRLEIALDPAVRFVSGSVSTWFVPTPGNRNVISFDLSDSLRVLEVKYHGQTLTSYQHQSNKLTVQLKTAPAEFRGEGRGPRFRLRLRGDDNSIEKSSLPLDSILIAYEGIPPENGSGSFTNAVHAGVPIVSTLSQPYGAADWWPCSQDLNDKVDSVLLVISVPPGNRAAANGMLISEEHRADRSIYRWKHKHPMAAYLVGVSVTNYAVYSDYVPLENGKSIEILNYVYPETLESTKEQTKNIIKPFQLYNELFVPAFGCAPASAGAGSRGNDREGIVRRLLSGRTLLRVWPGISNFAYDQDRRII